MQTSPAFHRLLLSLESGLLSLHTNPSKTLWGWKFKDKPGNCARVVQQQIQLVLLGTGTKFCKLVPYFMTNVFAEQQPNEQKGKKEETVHGRDMSGPDKSICTQVGGAKGLWLQGATGGNLFFFTQLSCLWGHNRTQAVLACETKAASSKQCP